jgi:protein-S-isoprenylcysteine O-methyltransferase Ste14
MTPALAASGAMWLAWGAYWLWASRRALENARAEGAAHRWLHLAPTLAAFALIYYDAPAAGPAWEWGGAALAAAGLGFSVWARVHLGSYWSALIAVKDRHQLIRTGPYALVRHPIYTGMLLALLGGAVSHGAPRAFLGVALALVTYSWKLRKEEAVLAPQLGEEYARYRREVKALVPFLY